MKSIDILITTWPRYPERNKYTECVVNSLRENLIIDKFETRWVISSESQKLEPENKKELERIAKKYKFELLFHEGPANLGANLNFANANLKGDFTLYVQDDFMCTEKIDVALDVAFFEKYPKYKLVRYYWRGNTEPRTKLCDTHFSLSKKCRNYYSDNPHIKTRDFHSIVGKYVTIDNSACEHRMNSSVKKSQVELALRRDPSDPEKPRTRFVHIGHKSSMTEKWYNHPSNVAKRAAAAKKGESKK